MNDFDKPLSRRLRYEVLRRDAFTCRYCGAQAPDVQLTVDHVTPRALGGSDDPCNLATACGPCNAGKTSVAIDGPVVADVSADAARWAAAMRQAALIQAQDFELAEERRDLFERSWLTWHYGDDSAQTVPLPDNWRAALDSYVQAGAEQELFDEAIRLAMGKRGLKGQFGEFRYFCGVVRRHLQQRAQIAEGLIGSDDVAPDDSDSEPARELLPEVVCIDFSGREIRFIFTDGAMSRAPGAPAGGFAWGYDGGGPRAAAAALARLILASYHGFWLADRTGYDGYEDEFAEILEHNGTVLAEITGALLDRFISRLDTGAAMQLPCQALRQWISTEMFVAHRWVGASDADRETVRASADALLFSELLDGRPAVAV